MKKFVLLVSAIALTTNLVAQNFTQYFGSAGTEISHSVLSTLDSGYIMTGLHVVGGSDTNIFVSKFNKAGNLTWTNSYGTNASESSEVVSITQLSDSSYVVAGATQFGATEKRALAFRIDKTGLLLWNKSHGCAGISGSTGSAYRGVKVLSNGNILAYGYSSCAHGDRDGMYRIYNPLGVVVSANHVGFTSDEIITDMIQTLDGGYFAVGESDQTSTTGFTSMQAFKMDATEAIIWDTLFTAAPNSMLNTQVVQLPVDSSFLLCIDYRLGGPAGPTVHDRVQVSRISNDGVRISNRYLQEDRGPNRPIGFALIDSGSFAIAFETFTDNSDDPEIGMVVMDTSYNLIKTGLVAKESLPIYSKGTHQGLALGRKGEFVFAGNWITPTDANVDNLLVRRDSAAGSFCDPAPITVLNAVISQHFQHTENLQAALEESTLAGFLSTAVTWTKTGTDCFCGESPILADTTKYCLGDSVQYNLPGTDVRWTPNTEISCTNCADPVIKATASRYYVYYVDTAEACSYIDSVYIEVSPALVVDLGPDTTYCGEDSTVLYPGVFDSYVWQDGSTDTSFVIGVSQTTGNYHVTVTKDGCTASDTVFITVASPGSIDGPGTIQACPGTTTSLNVTGGSTYSWSPNTDISCTTCANPDVSPSVDTWYYVLIDSAVGCSTLDSVFIQMLTAPNPNLGPDITVCSADGATLTPGVFNSYLWQDGSVNSTFDIDASSTTGWYHCTVTNAAGCSATDSVFVTVNQTPVVNLGPDRGLCPGFQITLDASSVPGPYLWHDGSTNPTFTTDTAGIFWVRVTANNCDYTDSVVITDFVEPNPQLGADTSICEDAGLTLSAGLGFSSYTWQDGSAGSNYFIPTIPAGQTNLYHVTVTSFDGCTGTDSIFVTGTTPSTILLDTNLIAICPGEVVTFSANVSDNDSIVWSNGVKGPTIVTDTAGAFYVSAYKNGCESKDTVAVFGVPDPFLEAGPDTLICKGDVTFLPISTNAFVTWKDDPSNHNAFRFISREGTYIVTASNKCGVITDTLVVLDKGCECNVYAPNVFTPNGDLENDEFMANVQCELIDFKLTIFNRWGDQVAVLNDQRDTWDGTVNGKPGSEGVYFYTLETESRSSREVVNGFVTLFR